MSFIKRVFGAAEKLSELEAASADVTAGSPLVASPWSPNPSHLNQVVWPDLLGMENMPMTRATAMTIPSVARSRQLIVGTAGRLPLIAYGADGKPLADQPRWLTNTRGMVSPFLRLLWTADDLLFHGFSLWRVERGAAGQILNADRVDFDRWNFDTVGNVEVDGKQVSEKDHILIPGIHEGVLVFGARAIRQYINLLASADRAASNPSAYLELHDTSEAMMTDEEIDALVARWSAARRGANGGVAYTNASIELKEHGTHQEHLLLQGRNAAAVDIARVMGIPAALIDAQAQSGSLTYETTQSRAAEFIDYGLAPLLAAISSRFSQDDMTPRGTKIGFALEEFLGTEVPMSVKTDRERVPDPKGEYGDSTEQ